MCICLMFCWKDTIVKLKELFVSKGGKTDNKITWLLNDNPWGNMEINGVHAAIGYNLMKKWLSRDSSTLEKSFS